MARRSRFYSNLGSSGALVDQFGNARVPSRNELLRTSNPPYNVVRSRPREHSRSGTITSKGFRSPTMVNVGFRQAVAVEQVGAKPLRVRNHYYYELGNGLFTKKQILESRRRYDDVKLGLRVSREKVGL